MTDSTQPEISENEDPSTPPISKDAAREARVMSVWREANKLFSGMRYGFSHPRDMWLQTRRQFGDTITSSREMRSWTKLKAVTDTLDDVELDYLRTLANQRFEFSAARFRINAITSVTIPISAAVVANQIWPGSVQQIIKEDQITLTVLFVLLLLILGAVFGNVFKARELRMALDVEAARRRLHRGELLDG